jgi:hypothetical protein
MVFIFFATAPMSSQASVGGLNGSSPFYPLSPACKASSRRISTDGASQPLFAHAFAPPSADEFIKRPERIVPPSGALPPATLSAESLLASQFVPVPSNLLTYDSLQALSQMPATQLLVAIRTGNEAQVTEAAKNYLRSQNQFLLSDPQALRQTIATAHAIIGALEAKLQHPSAPPLTPAERQGAESDLQAKGQSLFPAKPDATALKEPRFGALIKNIPQGVAAGGALALATSAGSIFVYDHILNRYSGTTPDHHMLMATSTAAGMGIGGSVGASNLETARRLTDTLKSELAHAAIKP